MAKTGNDLFIVDNSDEDWKVLNYLAEWSEISSRFDIATGYFEIGSLLALDGKWTRPAGRSWIYYVKRVIDAPPDALLGQLLSDKPSPDDAIHWLNGELDRVFPTAESMIEEMKLEDRFKDVTFETLDRDDFLASVEAAFPNLDWVKPYEAFKAAGEKINQKRVKGG